MLAVVDQVENDEKKERFESTFLPLTDGLYNFALRMTRNGDNAQDLVQETYLRAYRFYDRFQENTNAKAWIYTIMINTFRTKYRKSQKEPSWIDYDAVENYLPEVRHKSASGPANKSEARDSESILDYLRTCVSDNIISALENVPEQFRAAVLLSDVEQFDYQEISDIIGVNLGTVKSRIFRGRKILQKQLFEFARERGICRG
jgi:RNA polymerase sigma-70 factor (ECF subfamily)